jgi:hypothetical protein
MTNVPFIPNISPWIMPREGFEALIAKVGERTVWMRSHTCPCIYGAGSAQGRLPFPGSPDPACRQCFGVGTYWDEPSEPFMVGLSFFQGLSPGPDEPGTLMDQKYGPRVSAEPNMTVPAFNPANPGELLPAWKDASTDDIFVMVDMLARYTAVLQVGGIEALPYQQNLQIASSGAVTVYNASGAASGTISFIPYDVSGAMVTIDPSVYPTGTNYMVEFQAAPIFVVWRRAGGLPHVRPFGGGVVQLPRRFHLQALDWWTRQRQNNPSQAYGQVQGGKAFPYVVMSGQVVAK